MPTVVGVKLRNTAKPVLFDAGGAGEIVSDDILVVVTDRGTELGKAATEAHESAPGENPHVAFRVERIASGEDLKVAEELHRKEREAIPVFRRLVDKHHLNMKPTDVEFTFDGNRATFYFVAEERVDFRDLVRDLATEFHARVDMRQIGVRDEARMIGGLGHCGEQLCCARFGGEFQPVSIRMAKEQDLPLNPLKISGLCGRLMCCLRYENEAYKDFKSRAPKKGAIIEVGDQKGKVVEFNTPKETVTMRLEQGGTMTVGLDEMDCACEGTCPCRVRASVLEERAAASPALLPATRVQSSPALRAAAAVPAPAPSAEPAAAPAERSSRRRRRHGGSGGSGGAPKGGAGASTPPAQPKQDGGRSRQGSRAPKADGGGSAPPAAGQPASQPGRRRRRRSSGGGSGGAAAGGTPAAG